MWFNNKKGELQSVRNVESRSHPFLPPPPRIYHLVHQTFSGLHTRYTKEYFSLLIFCTYLLTNNLIGSSIGRNLQIHNPLFYIFLNTSFPLLNPNTPFQDYPHYKSTLYLLITNLELDAEVFLPDLYTFILRI